MHPCLNVDEILRIVTCQLLKLEAKATAVSLACCCRNFGDPVLDELWETQDRLTPLLKCLPEGVWEEEEDGSLVSQLAIAVYPLLKYSFPQFFQRIPTKAEWADLRKYTRRVKNIEVLPSTDPLTSEILLALQFRTANEPFLPRLKRFECKEPTEAFIPFIPFFLSPTTIEIDITFRSDTPTMIVAPVIGRLSTLCPELNFVTLKDLGRDPVITDAVSEMLLACNQDSLQTFFVDSPLTEEAREVLFQLPKLSGLWIVIQGNTRLLPVSLPSLKEIDVEFDSSLDWLQGFRGVTFERLEEVYFRSESEQIGDLLREFESVALTMSVQNTLSVFWFHTSRSWVPNYSSLLSFKQLKTLEIQFSCDDGCFSTVDDEIIASLAQAMPKLEILKLGEEPCETPAGVTVNGLVTLTSSCPHLSRLAIHFQADSLVSAANTASTTSLDDTLVVKREDCALTVLEVGEIPIPSGSAMTVTLVLLQIFPHILNIEYTNQGWKAVAEHIKSFRQIGTFIRRIGKVHFQVQLSLALNHALPGGPN